MASGDPPSTQCDLPANGRWLKSVSLEAFSPSNVHVSMAIRPYQLIIILVISRMRFVRTPHQGRNLRSTRSSPRRKSRNNNYRPRSPVQAQWTVDGK